MRAGKVEGKTSLRREDPRVLRSKRDLGDALEYLLTKKNFSDITIKEIADTAMVSKLTFYNNFADKNDLLSFIFTRRIDQMRVPITKFIATHHDVKEIYGFCIREVVGFFYNVSNQLKEVVANDKSRTFYWTLAGFIEKVLEDAAEKFGSKVGLDVPKELVGSFYAGAISNTLYKFASKLNSIKEKEMEEYITKMVS